MADFDVIYKNHDRGNIAYIEYKGVNCLVFLYSQKAYVSHIRDQESFFRDFFSLPDSLQAVIRNLAESQKLNLYQIARIMNLKVNEANLLFYSDLDSETQEIKAIMYDDFEEID